MLAAIKHITDDNFFFQQVSESHIKHITQSNCCSMKLSTVFLTSYGPQEARDETQ